MSAICNYSLQSFENSERFLFINLYTIALGLMIELRPLDVYFDSDEDEIVTNFTCSYTASEALGKIAFYTDSQEISSSLTTTYNFGGEALALHKSYKNTESLTAIITIPKGAIYVRCKVFDLDGFERGSMASLIHYFENRIPSQKRSSIGNNGYYTINGLPIRECKQQANFGS